MRCPFCSHPDTQVKDSRPAEDNHTIRRRRFCSACNSRFTTFERVQLREISVVKKTGAREIFDRDKLARSVYMACRKRNVPEDVLEKGINNIQRKVETSGDSEIDSELIGEMVMELLRSLDQVAYVRFASVYRDFREAKDFEAFVEQLRHPGSKTD